MGKKVGLITIHDIFNYGSVLQSYATQKVLTDLGYEVEIIDYKYPNAYHLNDKMSFKKFKGIILTNGNRILKNFLPGKLYLSYVRNYQNCKNEWYNLSSKKYLTQESLVNDPPIYDVYIAGSDQIWRSDLIKNDSSFFLEFAPTGKKRISFASSFGSKTILPQFIENYKNYLNHFDLISVREKQASVILKGLINKECPVVLDPTLLISGDVWRELSIIPINKKPFILCYGNSQNKFMERFALKIQAETGYDVIRINGNFFNYFNRKIKYILDAGPKEWLGYIANAEIILAASFHATAFAVNFNRPFISILRGNENHDLRQINLLHLLKIENRTININEKLPQISDDLLKFDFTNVNTHLEKARMKSISYLKFSLQEL